jgi:hypothetical protein
VEKHCYDSICDPGNALSVEITNFENIKPFFHLESCLSVMLYIGI